MLRNEWKFEYEASKLAAAAEGRTAHHRARVEWWRTKKDGVLGKIRSEGLEIDEKLVLEHATPKSRDWQDATRVTVRNDLRNDLNECLKKLAYHAQQLDTFTAWAEVLAASPAATLGLDHEDWRFFFSNQYVEEA